MENEDDDPVGAPADPLQAYTDLAVKHGLIRAGDKLDQNVIDFAADIVAASANIGDGYGDSEAGGNAGEHIRAVFMH